MNFNKKGNLDNLYVMIVFFAFCIFLLVAIKLWGTMTTGEINEDLWDKTGPGTTAKNSMDNFMNNIDNFGTLIYIALHIGVLVFAYLLRSHPIMYVGILFVIVIMMAISAPLSNAYEDLRTDEFITEAESLPKINFLMDKFPLIEAVWAFITAIVLCGLARSEGFI